MNSLYEVQEKGEGLFSVTVGSTEHEVKVEDHGGGKFSFTVDNGNLQTSHGHPVLEMQAPGVPPAAVISIVKGPKGVNLAWSTYWDSPRTKFILDDR